MNKLPVSYLQTDPKWANVPYQTKGESTTIGGSGCGPTSMAMVLATWADSRVTPKTECAWAQSHGYKALGHGTYYSYFVPAAKRYGLNCTQINGASLYGNSGSGFHAQVLQYLKQGDLIIACMGKGNWTRSGHFVLLWDVVGDIAYINDPASTKQARTRGSWSLFRQQVKYYWRVRKPNKVPLKEEEYEMDANEIRKIVNETLVVSLKNHAKEILSVINDETAKAQEPEWSHNEGWWNKATKAGITDGQRPESFAKRDEVIAMLGRMGLVDDYVERAQRAVKDYGMD